MKTISRLQWGIAYIVLAWSLWLFKGLGVTALLFVAVGLVYAAVAAISSRPSRLSMAVALLMDAFLAYACVRMVASAFEAVPGLAPAGAIRPARPDFTDVDLLAPLLLLSLIGLVFLSSVRYWQQVRQAPWL